MSRFLFYDDKLINILLKEERPSGGAAVQAYGWINGLREAGQEVSVLTSEFEIESLKDECRSLHLVAMYNRQKGIRWLRWLYYRLPHLYREIKKVRPDYLYQGVPGWQSFLVAIICRRLKIKYVQRISNDYLLDDRFHHNHSRTHRFFMRLGLKMAYCILCQNDYQYNIIKRDMPGKRAIKISNPIYLDQQTNELSASLSGYIAWIGLFQYQKNLPLLYDIASSLRAEQFYIAGKEEKNCDAETASYVEKIKALPNVKYVGFLKRDEVLPFLANAKFLLNTSRYEGFSNTFLEAMSAGVPIISSFRVNPDDIINRYRLGIVYDDLHDLVKQYQGLDNITYDQMRQNVLKYVLRHHNYKRQAEKLMAFLDDKQVGFHN
jgi:glycosyltransferase involved in cell wall biosynthesis